MAPSLMNRPCCHRLDVPRRKAIAVGVQLSLDNGRVGHDCPGFLEDEVEPPEGMVPVFVGELLGTLTPGFMKQPAKYCHVLRDELVARKPSYDRHLGKIPVQVLSPLRPMVNGFFRPVRRGETKGRFDVMPKEIDRDGLRRLLAIGAQLVEVLPPEEYAEDHLPGAINLPLRRLEKEGREVLDPGRPVVVYCWDSA